MVYLTADGKVYTSTSIGETTVSEPFEIQVPSACKLVAAAQNYQFAVTRDDEIWAWKIEGSMTPY